MRMYHPNLEPPHNECEALTERQAAVYAESGWLPAPEPEQRPGFAPESVQYAPVAPVKAEKRATKTSTAKGEGPDK